MFSRLACATFFSFQKRFFCFDSLLNGTSPNSTNPSPFNRPSPNRCPNDVVRFGDTAANVGVLTLLEAFESTRSLPLPVKSAAGSVAAGLWRIGLTPIDAYKTTLQVVSVYDCGTSLKMALHSEIDWDRLTLPAMILHDKDANRKVKRSEGLRGQREVSATVKQ